ncbi:MAG: hypothetical protein ACYS76_09880 [Planctomycetota bacterium]|jgi:hypothetical protein
MCGKLVFLISAVLLPGLAGNASAEEFATNPSPPNNDWCVPADTMLGWTKGDNAASHDVYFGIDFNDVNDADTTSSGVYRGNFPVDQNYFDPGALQEARTFYWRVDEVGGTTVKGNVWNFTTTSDICLKVDLALPLCAAPDCNHRWPESAKPGWEIWADPIWHDMHAHPGVLNDGSCMARLLGEPFNGPGIGGTGVMAGLTCVLEESGGLKMAGLEMCNMDASCPGCPKVYGESLYDPICNTWYQVMDWAELPFSIILLPLYNLPPGEYALFGYHNRFNGERNDGQPHWECICGVNCDCVPELPMTSIEAIALADAPYLGPPLVGLDYDKLFGYGRYPVGNPRGVELIQGAYNVPIQQVTSDDELVPSMIKFRTDGSAVLVIYEGTCCVEDNIRPSRMSARAILNAFVLQLVREALAAFEPSPEDASENVRPDVVLSWRPGSRVASHEVYLGTNYDSVKNATTSSAEHKATLPAAQTSYDPGGLTLGKTYFWRVDEVNEAETGSPWTGEVWSFSVINYIVVEDFESYGMVSNPIYDTWLDGIRFVHYPPYCLCLSGAIIALAASYEVPPDPVHSGKQAMIFQYANDGWSPLGPGTIPYYSETERMFDPAQDWTQADVMVLTLYFYGDPNNDANETEQMYVTVRSADVNGTVKYGYYPDEDMNDIKVAEWQEWNLELKDFVGVDMNNVSKMYIGFGDASSEVPGGWGLVYFDDIRLYAPLEADCFPSTPEYAQQYARWLEYNKPDCWCGPPDGSGYQCYGDADGQTSGFPYNYRVYVGDLNRLIANWKRKTGDPMTDPCLDIDHKDSGFPYHYAVYTGDLNCLICNWKKQDSDFSAFCPRPDGESCCPQQ